MQKIRVIAASRKKVIRGGVALVLNSSQSIEMVGQESADMLEEAFQLQPDVLVYELSLDGDQEYEALSKFKELCGWTKTIIFATCPLDKEKMKRYFDVCDGYLQGPILPGFLLKALELACYSGHFFFLGSSRDIKHENKKEIQSVMQADSRGNR